MISFRVILALIFITLAISDSCTVEQSLRVDCGYMGINQAQCEGKGCCWKPTRAQINLPQDTPWCFYPAGQNVCENITYDGKSGPGFDDTFYSKMYKFFDDNINILGKGGVVAAPDPNTPGGSYYYHWTRDGALTMRTYMELNDMKLAPVEAKMKAYVSWIKKVQSEIDPNGFDIRINPKYQLPNGQVYIGGWCRPQTDGPGLQSASLIMFANMLLENNQRSYVESDVIPRIKYDLEWVLNNWTSDGCDLWEEVRSSDFFWNRAGYVYTLNLCQQFFTKMSDSAFASRCANIKSQVEATLSGHWTGSYISQSSNRQKDSATIHAISSFDVYSITDDKVAKTIKVLGQTFCSEYKINQDDLKNGQPGILLGRYPGDSYAGGNPWQLLTAVLAKSFYQGATSALTLGFQDKQDKKAWAQLLQVNENSSNEAMAAAALAAGDSVLNRMYKYVKNDGGHITQQIGKNSGVQVSAKDLTWSYANILSALQQRKKVAQALKIRELRQE